MITLNCDKCGTECAWYLTDSVPKNWLYIEGNALCEKCAKEYNKHYENARKEFDAKVNAFFKGSD